jgi:hypothetical protein
MAIILKVSKVNLFVFWYYSPKFLDTPHTFILSFCSIPQTKCHLSFRGSQFPRKTYHNISICPGSNQAVDMPPLYEPFSSYSVNTTSHLDTTLSKFSCPVCSQQPFYIRCEMFPKFSFTQSAILPYSEPV